MKIAISMNHNEVRRAYRTFKKISTICECPCTKDMDAEIENYLNEDHSKEDIRTKTFPGVVVEVQDTTVVFDICPHAGGIVADAIDGIIDQLGGWIGFIRASISAFRGIVNTAKLKYDDAFARPKTYATACIYNHDLDLCHTFLIENDGYDNTHVKEIRHISGLNNHITPKMLEHMMWAMTEKTPLEFAYDETNYEKEFERYSAAVRSDWEGDNAASSNKTAK